MIISNYIWLWHLWHPKFSTCLLYQKDKDSILFVNPSTDLVEYWNQIPLFQISCKQDYPHDNLTELSDSFKSLIQERLKMVDSSIFLIWCLPQANLSFTWLLTSLEGNSASDCLLIMYDCFLHIKPEVSICLRVSSMRVMWCRASRVVSFAWLCTIQQSDVKVFKANFPINDLIKQMGVSWFGRWHWQLARHSLWSSPESAIGYSLDCHFWSCLP